MDGAEAEARVMPAWLAALVVTLVIEVPVVASFYPGQRRKMATVAAFSTTATNLFLNLVLVKARCLNEQHVIVGEVLALVLEAAAYAFMSRPRDVPRGVFVSALANALSFAAGFSPWLARLFD